MTAKKKNAPTTSSRASTKVSAKKVTATPPKKGGFPTRELKDWLRGRNHWNHDEWLQLLDHMRRNGYAHLVDSNEGQGRIGEFLETNRPR